MATRRDGMNGAAPTLDTELHTNGAASDGAGRRTDRIAEALKRYILAQRLEPGTRLPPERQLAEVLMVGRNAVREALQSLAVMGVVEQRHGSGVYVCDFSPDRLGEQLAYGLREDASYWRHLVEVRIDLETTGARYATTRITPEQLGRLRELVETMRRQAEQGHIMIRTNQTFHLELAACAGNPVLERLTHSVCVEYFRYASSLRLGFSLVGSPVSVQNHEPILAALEAHDPAATEEAMRYHFRDLPAYADELLARVSGPRARGKAPAG